MIKTINLTANTEFTEKLVGNGCHVRVENRGDGTVYASKYPGVVAGADNVMAIDGGITKILTDVCTYGIQDSVGAYRGIVYLLADTDTSVEITTTNNSNFRQIVKGGGDNADCEVIIEYVEKLPENTKQNTIYLVKTENTYLEYVGSKALGYLEFPDTPEILVQPINSIGNIGDTVVFKVSAIGKNLTYQWQYSKDSSIWYKATSDGNTTDTLTITIRSSIFENYYRCVITDTNGNKIYSDVVRVSATSEYADKEDLIT